MEPSAATVRRFLECLRERGVVVKEKRNLARLLHHGDTEATK